MFFYCWTVLNTKLPKACIPSCFVFLNLNLIGTKVIVLGKKRRWFGNQMRLAVEDMRVHLKLHLCIIWSLFMCSLIPLSLLAHILCCDAALELNGIFPFYCLVLPSATCLWFRYLNLVIKLSLYLLCHIGFSCVLCDICPCWWEEHFGLWKSIRISFTFQYLAVSIINASYDDIKSCSGKSLCHCLCSHVFCETPHQ